MNCLDFRRQVLTAPRALDKGHSAHRARCRPCREYAERAGAVEAALENALQVPVPEGLAERVLLERRAESRRSGAVWLAAAASVCLGVALTTLYLHVLQPRALAEALIAHVAAEPEALQVRQAVSPERVREAFAAAGGTLTGPLGEVIHLTPCEVEGRAVRHLVVDTAQGRVTVLILPEHRRVPGRTVVSGQGYAAVVLPAPRGSVGVVVSRERDLEHAESMLRSRMRWSG